MKKIKNKKKYLNKIFTKNGKFYKVFEVDIKTEIISARNLEKTELIIRETFKKFDEKYNYFGG
ncbi:MAG: hypothetical protein WC389_03570 [Lutibacter sp.]|jgi:hypothetical protein